MSTPLISIVIPYYNKRYEIELVLESIRCQDMDISQFEVVLMDDGSAQPIDDIVSHFQKDLQIKYIELGRTGNRSRVRNSGAAAATGKYILFLDSDIILSRDCVRLYLENVVDGNEVLLGYRTMLFPHDQKFITRKVIKDHFEIIQALPGTCDERIPHFNCKRRTGDELIGQWQLVYSHSLFLAKDLFQKSGGFDEEFSKRWGAEDVELGYRLWRLGARIAAMENIRGFHLYHPSNSEENIKSLLENYTIFLKNHVHWCVELFIHEYESWPIENIKIQKSILRGDHIWSADIKYFEKLQGINGHVGFFGITTEFESLNFTHATFLPTQSIEENPSNLIGLKVSEQNVKFDVSYVSGKYCNISEGLFLALYSELQKVSLRVEILGDSATLARAQKLVDDFQNRNAVIFTTGMDIHGGFNRANFVNLALACSEIGMTVGLEMFYDPYLDLDVNSGYLKSDSTKKIQNIQNLRKHSLNFVSTKIHAVMDSTAASMLTRGAGRRIFWEECAFYNLESSYSEKILPRYAKILPRTESDKFRFNTARDSETLAIGFDPALLSFAGEMNSTSNNDFTFLWVGMFTNEWSNLKSVVSAFLEAFTDHSARVKLVIAHPGNYLKMTPSEYRNDSLSRLVENGMGHIKRANIEYINEQKELAKADTRIEFHEDVLSEEAYAKLIASADVVIDSNALLLTNPLLVLAVAMGKKIIVPCNDVYNEFAVNNQYFEYPTQKRSALFHSGFIEMKGIRADDSSRYQLVTEPLPGALKSLMMVLFANANSHSVDKVALQKFRDRYSWTAIAKRLKDLIKC